MIVAAMRHHVRFALDPTPAQLAMLTRHAGASRFAYNQCLRLVTDALDARRTHPQARIPWSAFDLINAFNAWKRSEAAGRIFVAGADGTVKHVTARYWRREVSAQAMEEAAVDLGRALSAYSDAKTGAPRGRKVGFPRCKRKGRCRDSFRLRNRRGTDGAASIRVGEGHPRSVTLPAIGKVRARRHSPSAPPAPCGPAARCRHRSTDGLTACPGLVRNNDPARLSLVRQPQRPRPRPSSAPAH